MKSGCELLAPAGDYNALRAAVINGADAVYLALQKFGARAKAENFTLETLKTAVLYAHVFGVKIYVTVNTLLTDVEIDEALTLVQDAWACGVDAFIVQDVGLIQEIKRTMPDVVLHASTQLGIHNVEGAQFAKALGVKRIVLSRETSLQDVRAIKDTTDLEIEYFVHGALCVAFSGNCLLSSQVSGLSGNRGRCLQLCRKKYRINMGAIEADGYYLSPKDICLVDRLEELAQAGVDSFKIEGRLRSVEYVAETTRVYRKMLDEGAISESDRQALKTVFNRGDFCAAYLDGNTVIEPRTQGNIGLHVGTVTDVHNGRAKLATNSELVRGDGIKFMRKGIETGNALLQGNPTSFIGNVRVGDDVRLTSSTALSEAVKKRERSLPVHATVSLREGEPLRITLSARGVAVETEGAIVQTAKNAPLSDGDVENAIMKTGDTVFVIEKLVIENSGRCFLPKSEINGLRRKAFSKLYDALSVRKIADCAYYDRHSLENIFKKLKSQAFSDRIYIIESEEQLQTVEQFDTQSNIVVSPKRFDDPRILQLLKSLGQRGILELPIMANGEDLLILRQLIDASGVPALCVQNAYGFALAEGHAVLRGFGMNILNRKTAEYGPYMQSLEAMRVIDPQAYVYAFGYAPLMLLKHCPRKTLSGCKDCKGDFSYRLRDDKGSFFIRHYKIRDCYAQVLNQNPIELQEELDGIAHARRVYDFRNCDAALIEAIMCGRSVPHVHFNFNRKLV